MHTLRAVLIFMLALTASACGGPGSVTGTVSGISLNVQDVVFFIPKDDMGKSQGLVVIMADKPNICDTIKANRQPKSSTSLLLQLLNVKVDMGVASLLASDVGDYTVTSDQITKAGLFASGGFSKFDSNCTESLTATASVARSGLVKVTSVTPSANGNLQGTFDISIGTQADKLTGSLNAKYCDLTKIGDNPSCE